MPYIGRELDSGNYLKLDDISSSFNGSTTTFNLTAGGKAFFPGSAFSILVNLAGVAQEPEAAYQINNSQITFATAPASGDQFFCIVLGVAHGINVPGNGTVDGAKLAKPFNYDGYFYLDDANNRVGVGTATPQKPLHVVGEGQFDSVRVLGDLQVDGTTTTLDTVVTEVDRLEVGANNNTVAIAVTQSGSGDAAHFIGGDVGIGTNNPTASLQINSATPKIILRDDDNGADISVASIGGAAVYSAASENIFQVASTTEALRIDADGRLLLGATSSGANALADDLVISKAGHTGMTIRSTNSNNSSIYFADGTSGDAQYRGWVEYHHPSDSMRFGTSATERLKITSAGSVGIGTITPQSQFEVYGTSPIVRSKHSTSQKYTQINHNGTDGYLDWSSGGLILRGASNAERFRIDSAGDVGIGIADPKQKLHVSRILLVTGETSQIRLNANETDQSDNDRTILGQATGSNHFVNTAADNDTVLRGTSTGNIIFGIGTSEKIRITSAGNILVNHTDSDGSGKLQVFTGSQDGVDILGFSNNATAGGRLTFYRSKSNTVGNFSEVADGDSLGRIDWRGHNDDGTANNLGATIEALVTDDVDSTTDMPSDLVFKTSSNGSSSPTERLRITSAGKVGINETSPTNPLVIRQSSSNINLELHSTSSGRGTQIMTHNDHATFYHGLSGDTSGHYIYYTGDAKDHIFHTNNTERLRITSAGVLQAAAGVNLQMASNGRIFVGNGGNATDPMFANVSDTNTGIAFPAADTMLFTTGGTERLRISSNGVLGINKTPETDWASSYRGLEIGNSSLSAYQGGTYPSIELNMNCRGTQASYSAGWKRILGMVATQIHMPYSGTIHFRRAASGSADSDITWLESMRISSAGNVGIDQTNPTFKLDVKQGNVRVYTNDTWRSAGGSNSTTYPCIQLNADYAAANNPASGRVTVRTSNQNSYSGDIVLQPYGYYSGSYGFVEDVLRVSAHKRVGINDSNPAKTLSISNGSADEDIIRMYNDEVGINFGAWGTGSTYEREATINGTRFDSGTSPVLRIAGQGGIKLCADLNNERLRVRTDGHVASGGSLVASANYGDVTNFHNNKEGCGMYRNNAYSSCGAHIAVGADATDGWSNMYLNRFWSSGEDERMVDFRLSNTTKGTITANSSGVTYNTTSDIRLKTDINPISDATDKLMNMNPVTHKWKEDPDGDTVHGFIAQEMQNIAPEAVHGEPDGEMMMGMDYGRITPIIVAALQDAIEEINTLKQKISELEN